jgi:hypothetical protein
MAAELPLLHGVHGLDARDDLGRRVEFLEPQHRPGSALDRPVALFDEVVQVLGLAQLDGQATVSDQALHGGRVRTAFVDRDLLGHVVLVDHALEEAPGRGDVAR